jgi:hypothetical protein
MFHGFRDMNGLRKWNLAMVIGIASVLLAQRFVGHVVVWNEILERVLTILGVGLGVGVLLQLRKGHGK